MHKRCQGDYYTNVLQQGLNEIKEPEAIITILNGLLSSLYHVLLVSIFVRFGSFGVFSVIPYGMTLNCDLVKGNKTINVFYSCFGTAGICQISAQLAYVRYKGRIL